MDYLVITCDKVIESYNEETKTILTNFNEINMAWRTQNFYILRAFLLITIALLIPVSTYMITYRAKQKHWLSFHVTNNELKQVLHW